MLSVLFSFAFNQMADGQNRMVFEHSGAAVSHDCADLIAHALLIAVNTAVGAEGFVFHEGAFIAALMRISDQRGA